MFCGFVKLLLSIVKNEVRIGNTAPKSPEPLCADDRKNSFLVERCALRRFMSPVFAQAPAPPFLVFAGQCFACWRTRSEFSWRGYSACCGMECRCRECASLRRRDVRSCNREAAPLVTPLRNIPSGNRESAVHRHRPILVTSAGHAVDVARGAAFGSVSSIVSS